MIPKMKWKGEATHTPGRSGSKVKSGAASSYTVKQGNFDRRGNFDRSGSFVKVATVPIQECLFVASAFMEIND